MVRPEPGRERGRKRLARDERRRRARLFERVRNRFQPDPAVQKSMFGMNRAVADRENIGIARARKGVDDDAAVDREPRLFGELRVGHKANAYENEIGWNLEAVAALHRADRGSARIGAQIR